jgi:hypothetical protein
MAMRAQTWKVFKGKGGKFGALNVSFSQPHFYRGTEKNYDGWDKTENKPIFDNKDGWTAREGAVFFEMAATTAPDVYGWDKKIIFALSVNDMSQLLVGLRTGAEVKLMHDPGAGSDSKGQVSKYLTFTSPKGLVAGGLLSLSQSSGDDKRNYTVPLSGAEVVALGELLRVALTRALGW